MTLLAGMGDVKPGFYYVTSPPTLAKGVAVLGGWVADNVEVQEPSGVVRGFDPISGSLLWAWDLGRPDVLTAPPEGQTYTRGTPNAWSVFSADDELGLVYIPTGNATPDYYGGHRTPEAERFASSVVALDAATGAVRWSFQTTHHDIWDYDVPSQPVLVDLPAEDGSVTPALVAPTKRGELFLLDRRDGKPLADSRREAGAADRSAGRDDLDDPAVLGRHAVVRQRPRDGSEDVGHHAARPDVLPHPVPQAALRRSAHAAFAARQPAVPRLRRRHELGQRRDRRARRRDDRERAAHRQSREAVSARHCRRQDRARIRRRLSDGTPYAAFTTPFLSPLFAPCQQPPYGEIAAIDLKSRQTLWRRPLGTANEMGPLGLKVKLRIPMGIPYSAGTIVTKGGLIFVGGTMDRHMRALNIKTGEELWSDFLPNSAQATPMSYVSPQSGRQFVVITVPAIGREEESHVAEPQANAAPRRSRNSRQRRLGDRLRAAEISGGTMGHGRPPQIAASVASLQQHLETHRYICSAQIATAVYLAYHLRKPVLIEGPPGVGKTELAKTTAEMFDLPLIRLQCYEGLDEAKALYEWKYGKQLLYTQVLKQTLDEVLQGAKGFAESVKRLHEFGDIFFSEEFLEARPLLKALQEERGCVLLIDEVDKSDHEFESLLLEILSDYQVSIPEIGTVRARHEPPLVFLTSNNTREISDALKRRCLHLYIPVPGHRARTAHHQRARAGDPAAAARAAGALHSRPARPRPEEGAVDQRDDRLGAHAAAAARGPPGPRAGEQHA